jgi:peroxiredoxin
MRKEALMSRLIPRQPVPALEVATLDRGTWRLADQRPKNFTLVVFYRGLHCPICSAYLGDLDRKLEAFKERGVEVIAISSDTEERAWQSKDKWQLQHLTIGYGLDLDVARAWGLYISSSRGMTSAGVEEPKLFSEPGLFLIRPDGTLYFASVQTMPFARPGFGDILKAIDFVIEKDYPARGEVGDHRQAAAA